LWDYDSISFDNNGELLISPVAHEDSMNKAGIITDRVMKIGRFAELQSHLLYPKRGEGGVVGSAPLNS
jgi:hypothetical protein